MSKNRDLVKGDRVTVETTIRDTNQSNGRTGTVRYVENNTNGHAGVQLDGDNHGAFYAKSELRRS